MLLNASPERAGDFAALPLRTVGDRVLTLGEVASVRDGAAVQTSVARLNGANAVMVSIIKLGNASTVDIIREVQARLPGIRAAAPAGMSIEPVFDQRVFVQAAVHSVLFEEVVLAASGAQPAAAVVSVPANALQTLSGQPQVATLDAGNRLRFVPVEVRRTVGRDVELSRGLEAGTRVVLNVNAMLQEGQLVRPAQPL